ncbi:hypothetical protein ABPG72_020690 [Tetrahymena utriculariae]
MGNWCGGSSQSSSSSKSQRALRLRDEKKPAQQAKVVLLGNIAVGKTAITQRFKQGIFDPAHQATLGAAYIEKNITLQDNSVLSLHIWDTAGDERYRSILSMFYRDSQAAILVYDVTDADSFNSLQLWINELEDKAKTEGMIIALVGNKIDSPYEMVKVTTQKAEQFAREKNFLFTECSAKTGEGIDRIFNMIVEELIKKKKSEHN